MDINLSQKIYRSLVPYSFRMAFAYLRDPKNFGILAKPKFNDDGLITSHLPVFMNDPLFQKSYEMGKQTGALEGFNIDIQWRAHVACWAASHVAKLPGDFVECGVGRGLLSKTICNYLGFEKLNKSFYLIDTFEGLDASLLSETEKKRDLDLKMKPIYQNNFQRVSQEFKKYPNVKVVQGSVPSVLSQVGFSQVSYLSIDMNNAKPEIEAIQFFWPKLVSGAMVVLDDFVYGEEFFEQTQAFLAWSKSVGVEILCLPTGQGMIVKP